VLTPRLGETNAHNRPGERQEVRLAVVERGKRTWKIRRPNVAVGAHDVVGLFLLAELVTVSSAPTFGRLTPTKEAGDELNRAWPEKTGAARRHQATPSIVEGVIRDVVLGLEHQLMIRSAEMAEAVPSENEPWTEGVDQEAAGSRHRGADSDTDPGGMPRR